MTMKKTNTTKVDGTDSRRMTRENQPKMQWIYQITEKDGCIISTKKLVPLQQKKKQKSRKNFKGD